MSTFEPTEFPRLDPIDARCAEVAEHAALARTPLYDATRALLADLAELAAVETVGGRALAVGCVMSTETSADWCESAGNLTITGTRMIEHHRDSMGLKWCFTCRKRHEFWWVVMVPDGLSWYGPHAEIRGVGRECRDLFPGWSREWVED